MITFEQIEQCLNEGRPLSQFGIVWYDMTDEVNLTNGWFPLKPVVLAVCSSDAEKTDGVHMVWFYEDGDVCIFVDDAEHLLAPEVHGSLMFAMMDKEFYKPKKPEIRYTEAQKIGLQLL